MPLCNVTGTLHSLSGVALPDQAFTIQRIGVVGQDGNTIFPYDVTTTSDASANVDFHLYPGNYVGFVVVSGRTEEFKLSVPEAASASLDSIIDAPTIPLVGADVAAVRADRLLAEAAEATASTARDEAEAARDLAQSAVISFGLRNAANATILSGYSDGVIGSLGGTLYQVDSSINLASSGTSDLGVAGLALYADFTSGGYRMVSGSGVIRQVTSGSGWEYINDSGHSPVNFQSLAISGTDLRVTYSFTADEVGTFTVSPDETFAGWGVVAGASVGANIADISAFAPISGGVFAGTSGILYNSVLGNVTAQTVDQAAGTVTVEHISQSHTDARGTAVKVTNANTNLGRFVVDSQTRTQFVLQFVKDLACRIACTDTTPGAEVFTITETLNTGVSASWDSTNNCVLMTFPSVGSSNPLANVNMSRDGPVRYVHTLDAHGLTTVRIFFYDMDGTLITAATSSMLFYFTMPGNFPASIPSGSTLLGTVERSHVPCDMGQLSGTNGNLWLGMTHIAGAAT